MYPALFEINGTYSGNDHLYLFLRRVSSADGREFLDMKCGNLMVQVKKTIVLIHYDNTE